MRRDVVTQIIVEYPSGCENFATRLEAERFINANLEKKNPWRFGSRKLTVRRNTTSTLPKKTEKSTLWIKA